VYVDCPHCKGLIVLTIEGGELVAKRKTII
jgi:hypothetical protein